MAPALQLGSWESSQHLAVGNAMDFEIRKDRSPHAGKKLVREPVAYLIL